MQLRSISDTCYGVLVGNLTVLAAPGVAAAQAPFAVEAAPGGSSVGAAAAHAPHHVVAGTLAFAPGTSHDPGGPGYSNIQPPVFY
jgi:hypothetical protein